MNGRERRPERVLLLAAPLCEAERADPLGERLWPEVLASVRQVVPGAIELRPGWCAMRARGPARYYGSEAQAAATVLARAEAALSSTRISAAAEADGGLGRLPVARTGVANGRFAAQQAVRARAEDPGVHSPFPGVQIVEENDTEFFLGPLPIGRAADETLASVLTGLGVLTLGAFAALPEDAVQQRFGMTGLAAHRRARGLGELRAPEIAASRPAPDLRLSFAFEPPLDGIDRLAFACGSHAEAFVQRLASQGLVCTELLVELIDDCGVRHERRWSHPANFTPADVVNRVRWQAGSLPRASDRGGAGIAEVRLTPARTAKAAVHEPGLWNTAPDERVHHQITRVQSLVGHDGVGTAQLRGGRLSADRQRLLPWGTAAAREAHPRDGPWPGHLSGALPNTVFAEPLRARLLDADGGTVRVDEDELLAQPPATFALEADGGSMRGGARAVQAWSAPWPLREQWWAGTKDAARPTTRPVPPPRQPTERSERLANTGAVYRLQVVLEDGEAWLLRLDRAGLDSTWTAEGRYA